MIGVVVAMDEQGPPVPDTPAGALDAVGWEVDEPLPQAPSTAARPAESAAKRSTPRTLCSQDGQQTDKTGPLDAESQSLKAGVIPQSPSVVRHPLGIDLRVKRDRQPQLAATRWGVPVPSERQALFRMLRVRWLLRYILAVNHPEC